VQDSIRQYILDNKLRAGEPLPPEMNLCKQLGVSRTSVREAVKALESVGVLETRRGAGVFVRAFSFDPLIENMSYGLLFELRELADLLEVRRVLEVGMIGTAMQAMSDDQRSQLQQIVARMRAHAERGESFMEEDRKFHRCLFANLNNKTLLRLLDTFWLTFRKAAEHTDLGNVDPIQTYRDHAAILDAVLSGDIERVRETLEQHYAGIVERLTRARQEQQP